MSIQQLQPSRPKRNVRIPRKQKPKKGHVVRVGPQTWSFLKAARRAGETVDALLTRLLSSASGRIMWVIPSLGLAAPSAEEARGLSVIHSVKETKRLGRKVQPEAPQRYREVL